MQGLAMNRRLTQEWTLPLPIVYPPHDPERDKGMKQDNEPRTLPQEKEATEGETITFTEFPSDTTEDPPNIRHLLTITVSSKFPFQFETGWISLFSEHVYLLVTALFLALEPKHGNQNCA